MKVVTTDTQTGQVYIDELPGTVEQLRPTCTCGLDRYRLQFYDHDILVYDTRPETA